MGHGPREGTGDGGGPPFDPEELGTLTDDSLLLPHFTARQMKAQREGGRNRKQSWRGIGTKPESGV